VNGTQLLAMLWLRWRLTRNQWRRGGQLNAVIMLIVLVIGLVLGLIGGVAGVAGGVSASSYASPLVIMLVWDALVTLFLAFWTIGIVVELQQFEIIDISRLLHLPVSLRDVFLLNYVASHFGLSLAMMLPAMLGFAAGLTLGRGAAMVLLFPLALAFFFMITAWTYCLRSWLAGLMLNKRRRYAVIMAVTMALVLLAQLPNLVVNVWFRGVHIAPPSTASPEQVLAHYAEKRAESLYILDQAHRYVPLLWLPYAASALAEGRAVPALWCTVGMLAIGAWGLARAYRATARFYRRAETGTVPASSARTTFAAKKILVERRLPAIPEEAVAVALATFRSMTRAPEVKMALATNVLIFAILGATVSLRSTGEPPAVARPFMLSAVICVALMGLMQVMFNQFGFDRSGFRALVLLPAPRHRILLGKNLALLPMAVAVFAVDLALVAALANLRVQDLLIAVLEFAAALLAMGVLGNLMSILVPYRIAPGSLKPTRTTATAMLLLVVCSLLLPLAMLPVFLPGAMELLADGLGLPGAPVALACAVLLAVLSVLFYWQTLEPLGRLLERREQAILQIVTQEVE